MRALTALVLVLLGLMFVARPSLAISAGESAALRDMITSIPYLATYYDWNIETVNEACSSPVPWTGLTCVDGHPTKFSLGNFLHLGTLPDIESKLSKLKKFTKPAELRVGTEKSKREAAECSAPSPGPSYACEQNQWVYYNTTVLAPDSIVLNRGILQVPGSLYMGPDSNLVLTDLSSTMSVVECAIIRANIAITITKKNLAELKKASTGKVEASYSLVESSCEPPVNPTAEIVSIPDECRRYSMTITTLPIGERWSITAKFSYTDLRCNLWWIVLLSIIVITFVLLILFFLIGLVCCSKPIKKQKRTVNVAPQRDTDDEESNYEDYYHDEL